MKREEDFGECDVSDNELLLRYRTKVSKVNNARLEHDKNADALRKKIENLRHNYSDLFEKNRSLRERLDNYEKFLLQIYRDSSCENEYIRESLKKYIELKKQI